MRFSRKKVGNKNLKRSRKNKYGGVNIADALKQPTLQPPTLQPPTRQAPTLREGIEKEEIMGYFNLKYDDVKAYYSKELSEIIFKADARIIFDFKTIIKEIKQIMQTKKKEVNIVIGCALFDHLEKEYKSFAEVHKNDRKCIIPVGLPASGKSFYLKHLEPTHVICDADKIRDLIINSVLGTYFGNVTIPDDIVTMTSTEIDNWRSVYPRLIELFRNYIIFGYKSVIGAKNVVCKKGIEAYCRPLLIEYKADDLFIPQAIDIFLLFCKYKQLNFIYDATNTEPEFRYSLMMRCYLMGGYTNFDIFLISIPLTSVETYVEQRNNNSIRETTLEFIYSKLLSFFNMDPDLLEQIDPELNGKMKEIASGEKNLKALQTNLESIENKLKIVERRLQATETEIEEELQTRLQTRLQTTRALIDDYNDFKKTNPEEIDKQIEEQITVLETLFQTTETQIQDLQTRLKTITEQKNTSEEQAKIQQMQYSLDTRIALKNEFKHDLETAKSQIEDVKAIINTNKQSAIQYIKGLAKDKYVSLLENTLQAMYTKHQYYGLSQKDFESKFPLFKNLFSIRLTSDDSYPEIAGARGGSIFKRRTRIARRSKRLGRSRRTRRSRRSKLSINYFNKRERFVNQRSIISQNIKNKYKFLNS